MEQRKACLGALGKAPPLMQAAFGQLHRKQQAQSESTLRDQRGNVGTDQNSKA